MKLRSLSYLLIFLSVFAHLSCQKEVSFQNDIDNPGGGGNGGGGGGNGTNDKPGWSLTAGGNTGYYGCVDTAYYESMSGIKMLSIETSDSTGSSLLIILASPGNITATTYTPATGANMIFTDQNGKSYLAGPTAPFSIKITSINETSINAEFSGTLSDPFSGQTLSITNGKLNALIGKHNECTIGDPGTGNPGGGGNTGTDFYLVAAGGHCSDAEVQGKFIKDSVLTAEHKVLLDVWVDVPGPWSVSTSTINGFKFSGSGEFNAIGPYTITLEASGKPAAIGSFEIPVTAGSSQCNFAIAVDTIALAPCNQPNNSFTFHTAGIVDGDFSYVSSRIMGGVYEITANGPGDLRLQFPGQTQPKPGVYDVTGIKGSYLANEVGVSITASNIYWQPHEGKLYVTVVNGKAVATFCGIEFSGTLGGPSYKSKVSAKITEK